MFKKREFDAPFNDELTLHNPWPRFKCFVATLAVKNIGTPNKHCYDEIGLCAHNINTIFGSIAMICLIVKGLCYHSKKKKH